jgi:hypothetical protein
MTAPINPYASLLDLPMSTTERTAIEALVEHGSQNTAAQALGWKRTKLQSRLRSVQARARAAAQPAPDSGPIVHGHVPAPQPNDLCTGAHRPEVARYILTSAQNNTPVHAEFLANLEAYAEATGARIMVSRFSYNKSAYGAKATKAGRASSSDHEGLWYDPAIQQYICDDPQKHGSCQWRLAPDLLWCAEMNILPTAVRPLSGLESYSGPASGIFPHAKIALESVPVIGERPPKLNFTTGAVTQRNYIAKKEGIKAEFHHQFGALIVEVDLVSENWWCRQLNADDDGAFHDLTFRVADGQVTRGHRVEAISWGDIHASEIDPAVRALNWGRTDSVIDTLRPRVQLWHDTLSFRNRSHHEVKSFAARFAKHIGGADVDTVEAELKVTATLLHLAHRDFCQTVVVASNHDVHGERWLDEADYKTDLPNAELYLEAQLARVRALREGQGWHFLEWAMQRHGVGSLARFLGGDESFVVGPPDHPVECGLHGDRGPDGSRGSDAAYSRMATRIVKGHSHKACIRDGVFSSGVCNRRLPYAHGPSSWSVSHTVVYHNGKRAILTMRGGRLWL